VFVGSGVFVGVGAGVFVGSGVFVGAGVGVFVGSGVFVGLGVFVGSGVFVGGANPALAKTGPLPDCSVALSCVKRNAIAKAAAKVTNTNMANRVVFIPLLLHQTLYLLLVDIQQPPGNRLPTC
jgi:hypothetical protein